MIEEEIDMFADLEQTMLDCIDNLNITRHSEIKKPEIDVNCLEMVQDLSRIHGPAVRGYNLYKATKAFKEQRYLDSVYCETFALSLWMRMKFHANKIMEPEFQIPTEGNLADFLEEKKKEEPEFITYIDRFMKNLSIDDKPKPILKSIEFENGTELMKLCNEFPKEWTVIQLCKQVNFDQFLQTRDEALRSPRLIFMTLFCYPMSERFNHQPIKIVLNQTNLKDLYETCHDFSTKMNSSELYQHFRTLTNKQFETDYIDKIKTLLGPWIVLFSGKSKDQDVIHDKYMITQVDKFLSNSKHKYSQLQNVLICLITRRINMLNDQHIKEGALYISNTKEQWFELMDFFYEVKSSSTFFTECYPVILVVDEQIDFFYWEMCNPVQEFTRVDSLVTLLKLYFHHQKNITNGYFQAKRTKGSAVLNPDLTLGHFNTHVQPFIKTFTDWTFLLNLIPTFDQLRAMLANSDIYIYGGHGSGLQFISSYETCQLVTNAVVFLMGCSSVAFKSANGYAMGSGAHQYYHIANSPAVIGHLNTAYLNIACLLLNITVAKWLNTTDAVDSNLFGTSTEDTHFAKKLQEGLRDTVPSSSLPKVISQCRRTNTIPIAFRAILCYRGLPVASDVKIDKILPNRLNFTD